MDVSDSPTPLEVGTTVNKASLNPSRASTTTATRISTTLWPSNMALGVAMGEAMEAPMGDLVPQIGLATRRHYPSVTSFCVQPHCNFC